MKKSMGALVLTMILIVIVAVSTYSESGETDGPNLHRWMEPTLQVPKTCSECGFASDEYLSPECEVLATREEMYSASEKVILYKEAGKYGVLDNKGNVLIAPAYTEACTALFEDSFALGNIVEGKFVFTLFDKYANILWITPVKYQTYDFKGYADGYITLHDKATNIWVYLDAKNGFKEAAFVEANKYGVDSLSLSSGGYVAVSGKSTLGYPYLDIKKPAFMSGKISEKGYIESRGCAPYSDGNLAVTYWKLRNSGKYAFESAGFYNVRSKEYFKIDDWFDSNFLLKHIYISDSNGMGEYDSFGDFALIQSGKDERDEPFYGLYDIRNKSFVSDTKFKELYLSSNANIAGVSDEEGELKYSFLDSQFELTGRLWDKLTFLPDDLGLALSGEYAYFTNANLAVISDGIEATDIDHRFSGYFIIRDSEGSHLVTAK